MTKSMCSVLLLWSLGGLACAAEPESKTAREEEEQTVRLRALQAHPKLAPRAQLKIEAYDIAGLWDALKVKVFLVRYLASDGQQFNDDLWVYRDGKASPFATTFGGYGLMSAVVSGNNLYYTYSWGSGRHRSHVGRLAIDKGELSIVESGGFADVDLCVKEVNGRVRVEQGTFRTFNAWKRGKSLGTVEVRDSRLSIVDEAGTELSPHFPPPPKPPKPRGARQ